VGDPILLIVGVFLLGAGIPNPKIHIIYILYARRTWGLALFVEGIIKERIGR
jgi:hypothetical protein